MKPYEEIINALEKEFDDDEYNETLEKAMNYYCSLWDIREGYKHAIILTLADQYQNHEGEQDPNDLVKLKEILKLK